MLPAAQTFPIRLKPGTRLAAKFPHLTMPNSNCMQSSRTTVESSQQFIEAAMVTETEGELAAQATSTVLSAPPGSGQGLAHHEPSLPTDITVSSQLGYATAQSPPDHDAATSLGLGRAQFNV